MSPCAEVNYDEQAVPEYVLPEAMTRADGRAVRTADDWPARRAEILDLFSRQVYGRTPQDRVEAQARLTAVDEGVFGGLATRKQIRLQWTREGRTAHADVLLYVPRAPRPAPAFVGLNFFGNHTVEADPRIALNTGWMRTSESYGIVNHRATQASRGKAADRWPIELILSRGYALATVYCGDLAPDSAEHYRDGVMSLFEDVAPASAPEAWGAIGAWAWGLSRVLDHLETEPDVDASRVIAIGHSRLGKTALWAAAQDDRFAAAVSNNSGCGGAALSRRRFGETVCRINHQFPHWFCGHFKQYDNREDDLPIDQHQLLALIAPRPLYVASAEEDRWADPRGEFLSAVATDPVYQLLDTPGLNVTQMPDPHTPVGQRIGYHLRSGPHGITEYDWQRYLDFFDRQFGTSAK